MKKYDTLIVSAEYKYKELTNENTIIYTRTSYEIWFQTWI